MLFQQILTKSLQNLAMFKGEVFAFYFKFQYARKCNISVTRNDRVFYIQFNREYFNIRYRFIKTLLLAKFIYTQDILSPI